MNYFNKFCKIIKMLIFIEVIIALFNVNLTKKNMKDFENFELNF